MLDYSADDVSSFCSQASLPPESLVVPPDHTIVCVIFQTEHLETYVDECKAKITALHSEFLRMKKVAV